MIEYLKYGDAALLINFEQKIDEAINDKVIAFTHAIKKAIIPGVLSCTPAYCSITVGYDALQINYELLVGLIKSLTQQMDELPIKKNQRKLLIPVCYEPPYSLDLDELEKQLNISREEIIKSHTSSIFRVYMLGFLPGFAYMGILPDKLNCQRKKKPRLKVPARSVGLAGKQTGIYPLDAPGGWQIIGQTPLDIFDPKKENPFLFEAGDLVQFYSISKNEYEKMENNVIAGKFNLSKVYAQL